jgi:hypothetical protein
MRFVESIDYGDVPATFVSGIASVRLASPGTVEVTFYQTHELPDGSLEHRVVARQIWDRMLWVGQETNLREAQLAIERKPYLVQKSTAH